MTFFGYIVSIQITPSEGLDIRLRYTPRSLDQLSAPSSRLALAYSKLAELSLLRGFREPKFRLHAERPNYS
jgi:hypothetical protein